MPDPIDTRAALRELALLVYKLTPNDSALERKAGALVERLYTTPPPTVKFVTVDRPPMMLEDDTPPARTVTRAQYDRALGVLRDWMGYTPKERVNRILAIFDLRVADDATEAPHA